MNTSTEKWILRVAFEDNSGFQEVGTYPSKERVLEAEKQIREFKPYATEILKKMDL